MAVPVPHTFTAGDDATSTVMQTLTDAANWMLGNTTSTGARRPSASLRNTLTQSLATSGTTGVAVAFDTEDRDYDNGHSTVTNTSRYTVNTAGIYVLSGVVDFNANATGNRSAEWRVNGAVVSGNPRSVIPAGATNDTSILLPTIRISLSVADYVEIYAWQTSGGALLINTARMDVDWAHN